MVANVSPACHLSFDFIAFGYMDTLHLMQLHEFCIVFVEVFLTPTMIKYKFYPCFLLALSPFCMFVSLFHIELIWVLAILRRRTGWQRCFQCFIIFRVIRNSGKQPLLLFDSYELLNFNFVGMGVRGMKATQPQEICASKAAT